MTTTIKVLVDAGKANAGPPLGPALGPLGVNTMDVVNEINNQTKDLTGMQVPVKVHIESDKSFSVEVGAPLASALIKKELNLKKAASKVGEEIVGNLTFEQLMKVTKAKYPQVISRDMKNALKEIIGTCRSMGVTIENMSPSEMTAKINAGEFDSQIN